MSVGRGRGGTGRAGAVRRANDCQRSPIREPRRTWEERGGVGQGPEQVGLVRLVSVRPGDVTTDRCARCERRWSVLRKMGLPR